MRSGRIKYLAKRSAPAVLVLGVFVVLSYVFPGIQPMYPILSILLLIYLSVVFGLYQSYDRVKDRLFQIGDKLKNDVAAGRVLSSQEFGKRLVAFVMEAAASMGVDAVLFKAVDSDYVFSNRELVIGSIPLADYSAFEATAKTSAEPRILRRGDGPFGFQFRSILLVPIIFDGKNLGFFAVCSSRKVFNDLDTHVFEDLENYMIDDSFHSLGTRRMQDLLISLERSLDAVTNRVADGELKDKQLFLEELASTIAQTLKCPGAYFSVNPGYAAQHPRDLTLSKQFLDRLEVILRDSQQPILIDKNDPNIGGELPFPFLVSIPISFQDTYLGSFGSFFEDKSRIGEISSILNHVEDTIIDNYIHMLWHGIPPQET